MKKLLLLICLCLCVKSFSQNSSLITYKDAVHGLSFKYPKDWDSTAFNNELGDLFKGSFGAIIPSFSNDPKGRGFFSIDKKFVPNVGSVNAILGIDTIIQKSEIPNSKIVLAEIRTSNKNEKYTYSEIQFAANNQNRMFISINFKGSNCIYNFLFNFLAVDYNKLNSDINLIINSFQFNK